MTRHQQEAHGHPHGASPDADWRRLAAAFMAAEVAAGLAAHSLALLSDAAHVLTDAAAIGLALATARVAGRPARGGYTYGLRRLEILSAQGERHHAGPARGLARLRGGAQAHHASAGRRRLDARASPSPAWR